MARENHRVRVESDAHVGSAWKDDVFVASDSLQDGKDWESDKRFSNERAESWPGVARCGCECA